MNKQQNDIEISKRLSYLLRHGAIKERIPITKDGWVLIKDLLNNRQMKGISEEEIKSIVAKDPKKRYSIQGEGNQIKIRANQGHSINVQVEMKEITDASLYPIVIHGTYMRNFNSIIKNGLQKMGRLHIHMAQGLPKEIKEEKSGMRSSCNIIIYIDIEKAMKKGIKFYESENGVILSEGPIDISCFKEIRRYPSLTKISFN
ncbi:tRNA 2'-phosphotransferase, putative [Entamoeba dispar SAW760]|uniref:2'-phosphotransferase n=1 Tax=Entamoeba dispar (strain ATCC PRA-260 / SAW760) TaxID=370354 RepID=B0E890_ENTDS|nr:tRNA 2'-phosphotransferase, putative [Entamoeba dispar SAW760]EDR29215.1 tRNA 2'-phosphotransferase, putative [Entamoeba dispar SAW760]|eukprot:EDR29215.1 tRNA 2'-phosphotransferase, putative [Entamoeba dispar SAW760]